MRMLKFLMVFALPINAALAANLDVEVVDNQGAPIANVVVYLEGDTLEKDAPPSQPAIMDQVDRQFKPHILVIQKGTDVSFPNSDSIKHHVYSFSPTKVFELQLYKGTQAEPVRFGRSGEVELGCNVHDWMLGYIFVVDTPYFAKTDAKGLARFELGEHQVNVKIWHPLLQESSESLIQKISLSSPQKLKFQLNNDMLESTDAYEQHDDEFGDYE